jgi:hypothetical protein
LLPTGFGKSIMLCSPPYFGQDQMQIISHDTLR